MLISSRIEIFGEPFSCAAELRGSSANVKVARVRMARRQNTDLESMVERQGKKQGWMLRIPRVEDA